MGILPLSTEKGLGWVRSVEIGVGGDLAEPKGCQLYYLVANFSEDDKGPLAPSCFSPAIPLLLADVA
jgi:hypothetical protein